MGRYINCPKLTYEEFMAIPNGSYIANHGGDQCVALANQYHEGTWNGSFVPVYSAFQWWTDFNRYPTLDATYVQVNDNPQRGDIFIGRYGPYQAANGHIGVVARSWDGSTFGTIEQGLWNGGSSQFVTRFNRSMANILGFLRPKNLIPKPIPEIEEDMYSRVAFSDGWAGIWNMATGEISHIPSIEDYLQFDKNMKTYTFKDRAEFDAFKARYPWLLPQPKIDLSQVQVNVDAIADAVAGKIDCTCDCGCGIPIPDPVDDVTTKQDIIEAIELNYPEDK